jgi:hypothetical protein
MPKLYDLAVSTGKYQDQTGATKSRWKNIGAVMPGKDGSKYLLIDRTFNPAGLPVTVDDMGNPRDSISVSLFEVKDQQNGSPTPARTPQNQQTRVTPTGKIDDDLDF